MRGVLVVVVALWSAGATCAGTVLLPSPTGRIGLQPPLGSGTPTGPTQIPRPPRADNDQQVLVDVARSGEPIEVRVRQRLTLRGLGDFFFQIPAPVRDVQPLPDSQGDPGLRRAAVVWQGFSPGRRVLAAELALDPKAVAPALPLRLGRDSAGFTLRNTTAVDAPGFTGRVGRASARRALRIAAALPANAPAVEIDGATRRRRLRVEAPLRIRATVLRGGRILRRTSLVLGGPRPMQATVPAPLDAELRLTAEPAPLVSDLTTAPGAAGGRELLARAERALLRLARVNQYRTFLSSPASGRNAAVYRYRTVAAPSVASRRPEDDGHDFLLVAALVAGGMLALGGAVVAWAHL